MLDQKLIRRGFARAAAHFDEHDFLHREIRDRLLERLQAVRIEPRTVLDLGAGTGGALASLRSRFPNARTLPVDLTPEMLAAGAAAGSAVCADAARLPLQDASVDVVFSNLMLHHCPEPPAVLAEVRRVLTDDGVFVLTTLGPTSLLEVGRAWATADSYTHIAPFTDMHDLGDLLVRSGFAEPVLDSQVLTVTYGEFDKLVADLRHAGGTNANAGRNPGLTGRNTARLFRSACEAQASADGRIPVTIEVVFAIAWAGALEATRPSGDAVEIPLDALQRRPR